MEGTARFEVLAQLLEQLREPLLIASQDGNVRAANTVCADALGTSMEALDGAPLATYSPDPVALVEKLRHPSRQLQVPLRAVDGRRYFCDASRLGTDLLLVRLSRGPDGESRAKHLFSALSRLSMMASVASDALEEVSGALLGKGVSSLGALGGAIFLVDDAGRNLELKVSASYPSEYANRYRLIPLSARLPITDAVKTGMPVFLEGFADYSVHYPEFAAAHPEIARNAFAALPLEVDGVCVGALMIGFGTMSVFGTEERGFLSFLAVQCAKAIARAKGARVANVTALADPAALRLERLHSFTGALAQAITVAEVARAVVEMGMSATSATSGELWLFSREHNEVSLSLSVGTNALRAEDYQRVQLDQPSRLPILDALDDGTPVWVESAEQLDEQYPELGGTQTSIACVPLFAQGRCIGGIAFGFDNPHRFLEAERAFLQVISWHSAQAIERARLYSAARRAKDEAEESRRRSDFIASIGTLLSSSLDTEDVLRSIAAAAVPGVADWCIVMVSSERLRLSTFASHADPSKQAKLIEMSNRISDLDHSGFGVRLVMQTGRSLHHPEITMEMVDAHFGADPELMALIEEVGTASAMVVPISARGSVLGAIILNRSTPERTFDLHDLAIAEELGRRAGLAIDNARLYQESREADRLKDEFLAMLSHELRNPLSPILTAVELMNLRGGEPFGRERAIISRHVHQVVRLVDDLLDVSRVTRGKVQLSKQYCELSSILATAIEMVSPLAEQRRHRLLLVGPSTALPVVADQARLAQALSNVLTNAAKYTPPGGDITIHAVADESEAVIRVQDSGIGISRALLPRVFDLFVQGETSLDRGPGGLGIGLTVVRSIVQMHGGSVSIQSEGPGCGSEFTIRLPLAAQDVTPIRRRSERPPRPTATTRRVLIVDDNQDAASLLGEALEALGWTTQLSHDGPTALAMVAAFRPQLVLLDIGLPGMDGYELARNMRRLDLGPNVRLIAVTGYGQASDRERSREAGFDDHIVKPVHLDTLRRVIEPREAMSLAPAELCG